MGVELGVVRRQRAQAPRREHIGLAKAIRRAIPRLRREHVGPQQPSKLGPRAPDRFIPRLDRDRLGPEGLLDPGSQLGRPPLPALVP